MGTPSNRSFRPRHFRQRLFHFSRIARRPFERFLRLEAASGILLLVAAAAALVWTSSPWADSYQQLWQARLGVRFSEFSLERPAAWFVNDGLMTIFFFVVGLEIRREIDHGVLSEWRRAVLPATAALGGMLAPALLYLGFAGSGETRAGWGVPMATDIAFAVGILTLLGKRVPAALRVLLLALAIIDDLGAILVIALFYSAGLALSGLAIAAFGFAAIWALQKLGVRTKLAYVCVALLAWAGVYSSGIHPTIAGVIIGLMTPVRASHGEQLSPADSLIELLHPWVAFVIMPVFALANAGVELSGLVLDASSWRALLGVSVGLIVGKPVGVLLAIWLTLKLRLGLLPAGLSVKHLVVLGVVAGIGFTMALFIAQLGFANPQLLSAAKLGVLAASGIAAILALGLGLLLLTPAAPERGSQTRS